MTDAKKSDLDDLLNDGKRKANQLANEAKESFDDFTEGAKGAFDELSTGKNKKLIVGLLAIFLGALGIHKFVLGYNKEGIIMLVVTLIFGGSWIFGMSLMGIVGLIEGITYLTKSNEEFYNTYLIGKKAWF